MAETQTPRVDPAPGGWLHRPRVDAAMAFLWVPFAVAAEAFAGHPERLQWLVAATLLFSFAHQPLTLWLVYGDAGQRRAHRTLFTVAPFVVLPAVALGSWKSPVLVALVAGAWNLGHTMRQRYGVSRLYGRRCGIDCSQDNRLLWSWLAVAALVAIATTDLQATAHEIGLGRRSTTAIEALGAARPLAVVLLPVAFVAATVLTRRAVDHELDRTSHSPARLVYLGSTALLLAVLAARPVTGFVAYVGAHAAEYLLVVRWRVDQAAQRDTVGDRVGGLAKRVGGTGTILIYATAVVTLIVGVRATGVPRLITTVVLTLGALHLLYDGIIWRSPARARPPDP